jgi:hypothetical protein
VLSDFIPLIEAEIRSGGYRPMPAAQRAEVEALRQRSIDQLGHELPNAYLEFISLMDGFYISSMQLFASTKRTLVLESGEEDESTWVDDVIGMNLELRADRMEHESLISLVYDQMLRGWDPVAREWYAREHVRGRHRTYRNFEELLADGLMDVGVDTRSLVPMDFAYSSFDDAGNRVFGTRS